MTIARFERIDPEQYRLDTRAFSAVLPLQAISLPSRATVGSAGYDFVCPVSVTLAPGSSVVIPTGICARMEIGWVLLLFPRSSLGFKHHMRLANTVGVIDSDYIHAPNGGHILVKLVNGSDHAVTLSAGDRFCQGVFLPFGLAEEEALPGQREGGLGSTGR